MPEVKFFFGLEKQIFADGSFAGVLAKLFLVYVIRETTTRFKFLRLRLWVW